MLSAHAHVNFDVFEANHMAFFISQRRRAAGEEEGGEGADESAATVQVSDGAKHSTE